MANCQSCSAPLPVNINRCLYCSTRNDLDLNNKYPFTVIHGHADRTCPHCDIILETIQLHLDPPFEIERCDHCFGLFFDPGEIEAFLDSSVSNVFGINLTLIDNINSDRHPKNTKVKYIQCPVCQELMNRVNFGHRSGVVVDQCRNHGIWLDNGEITHLMEWKKAGGELLDTKKKNEIKTNNNRAKLKQSTEIFETHSHSISLEDDLFSTIFGLINKIF